MTDVTSAGAKRAHGNTSTIFVLGLLSLMCPQIPVFGPCAWYFGSRLLATYDAEPGKWAHRGLVNAGRIMGIIGTAISGLLLMLVIVLVALRPR